MNMPNHSVESEEKHLEAAMLAPILGASMSRPQEHLFCKYLKVHGWLDKPITIHALSIGTNTGVGYSTSKIGADSTALTPTVYGSFYQIYNCAAVKTVSVLEKQMLLKCNKEYLCKRRRTLLIPQWREEGKSYIYSSKKNWKKKLYSAWYQCKRKYLFIMVLLKPTHTHIVAERS